MELLARVSKLVGANLRELVDKAEEPERVLQQVQVDMQNQLMQLKTQVAMSSSGIAHLRKDQEENERLAADWARKALVAVAGNDDAAARAALESEQRYRQAAARLAGQVRDRQLEVERLKSVLRGLGEKMGEAKNLAEMLGRREEAKKPASAGGSFDPASKDIDAATKEQEIERMLRELKSRKGNV